MPQRRSIRLPDYDYAASGAYFVTICSYEKECIFGEIVDGVMIHNSCGMVVQQEWKKTALQRSYVELDAFVVMPNHVHGIVIIDHSSTDAARRGMMHHAPTKPSSTSRQFSKPQAASLASIVGTFKAAVTRQINHLRDDRTLIWQRNYYEAIIRDDKHYEFIAAYIETNPQRWTEDKLYPNPKSE